MDPKDVRLQFGQEFSQLWSQVEKYTIVSPERGYATYRACYHVAKYNIAGCFVECGVFKGGMCMLAALVFAKYAASTRDLFLFDTFSGMTDPTDADVNRRGEFATQVLAADPNRCRASLDEVMTGIRTTSYPTDKVRIVKGDVCFTLLDRRNVPEEVAVLRLDTDWYNSTRTELAVLYERVTPGGVILIDDYGNWSGARRAVDEFLESLPYPVYVSRTDTTGIEFVKPHVGI